MAAYNEVIAPLPFIGNIEFYCQLVQQDLIVDVHENYIKQSLRNRCEILGSQGRFSLTVPVHRPSGLKTPYKEIKISYDEDWRVQHQRTIRSAYGSSPFFIHYWDDVSSIWDAEPKLLIDFSLQAHAVLAPLLGIDDSLRLSENYISTTPGLDIRSHFKKNVFAHPRYIQVFGTENEFEQNLSILDLLFCLGPEAHSYLLNVKTST